MNDENETRSGWWWLAGLATPYVGFGIGCLLALNAPHNPDDWLGGAMMLRLFGASIVGIVLCICFTVVSFRKREKYAGWALFGWLGVIVFLIIFFAH